MTGLLVATMSLLATVHPCGIHGFCAMSEFPAMARRRVPIGACQGRAQMIGRTGSRRMPAVSLMPSVRPQGRGRMPQPLPLSASLLRSMGSTASGAAGVPTPRMAPLQSLLVGTSRGCGGGHKHKDREDQV